MSHSQTPTTSGFFHQGVKRLAIALFALTGLWLTSPGIATADIPAPEVTMQQLIKVMPGASVIMLQMGERYKNLYWAAKQGKWEFAEYQTEEMEDLLKTLKITRPARAKTTDEFLHAVFPMISEAAASRDWPRFEHAFEVMRHQCMACHEKNDHAFVTLPIPKSANSPVLGME